MGHLFGHTESERQWKSFFCATFNLILWKCGDETFSASRAQIFGQDSNLQFE